VEKFAKSESAELKFQLIHFKNCYSIWFQKKIKKGLKKKKEKRKSSSYILIYTYETLYRLKKMPPSSFWVNWTHMAIVRLDLAPRKNGTANEALLLVGSLKYRS
jgi:hypothetical protein